MFKSLALAATLALGAPAAVLAQAIIEPVGYTGAIVSTTAESVTLKDKDGKIIAVALMRGWKLVQPRVVPSDALKVGDFVGSANEIVNENTGRSTEIRVYEPGNTPEWGTHAMGGGPRQMTHGTVAKITPTATGRELEISYPNGGRRLLLASEIPVVGSVVLPTDQAKPGVVVQAVTRPGPDGVWRSPRLLLPRE
jgi:hypothetical protein